MGWYDENTAAGVLSYEWDGYDPSPWASPPTPNDFNEQSVCDGCYGYVSDYELVVDTGGLWFCEDCVETGTATEMGSWETLDDDWRGDR